ncbi:amidase [Ascodesmis nigricans]|uniref:amidase n=1 Tax=Ascodesmis nigricans TaxID=341454 RepID=A0A4S2MTR5_9PEZI|nr:amidase [Ascodesmis nigricans]
MPQPWEEIGARKRHERDSKIPMDWTLDSGVPESLRDVTHLPYSSGILSARELDITGNYTAQEIIEGTIKGKWTSVEVTVAFCKRAAIAHQATNCLTEIFFDEAISRARALDKYLNDNSKPLGLLHGLPISLKDCFDIKGYDTTLGFSARAFKPASKTSTLAKMLLDAGAILYVKTTTPQGQMSFDTHSYLFGRTFNPYNRALSAGGSSGGEAALIAMKGAIIGVAGDLGGSIRVPAANCGLYGIKPSAGRIPAKGAEGTGIPGSGGAGLAPAFGPIGRTLGDCRFFLDVMARLQPWTYDGAISPYSIRYPPRGKRLSIGVLRCDGVVMPHPPVLNVLDDIAERLRIAGHRVYEIAIPEFAKALSVTNGYLTVNGNEEVFDLLAETEEPLSPWLAARMKRKGGRGLKDLYGLNHKKQQLEQVFLERLWEGSDESQRLDAILSPVAGHATPPHDAWRSQSYTSVWNLLDYPAGVIPVRTVNELELAEDVAGDPLGPLDKLNRKLWDSDKRVSFIGAPIALQVIGRKQQEADLFTAMQIVDGVVKNRPKATKL